MTVSRDTTPATYDDLLAFWQEAAPPAGPPTLVARSARRRRPVSRLILLAYFAMTSMMLATYATLLWAIDVVSH
ncbi:MAG: hypothetical protein ABIO16_09290 [Nocardioides sp.]